MAKKNVAVYGIYPYIEAADRAIDVLTAQGFSEQDVSVLMSDTDSNKDKHDQCHTPPIPGALQIRPCHNEVHPSFRLPDSPSSGESGRRSCVTS